jgi:hypothetical protein
LLLHTSPNKPRREGVEKGETSPLRYEKVLLPQHDTVVGGITHNREEEAIVADGKTPLSEIPFEDVVLDHKPSGSSFRASKERYNGNGRDMEGYTNS